MSKYKQGIYKIKNPKKYKGDINKVYYRSSWELRVFKYMDDNQNVLEWSSEEIKIPYISPVDGKLHTYYPDLLIKVLGQDKRVSIYLIEIKPYKQSIAPTIKKNITKQYINEVCTWGVNQAKWKSARQYCLDRDWQFKIWTEKELGL